MKPLKKDADYYRGRKENLLNEGCDRDTETVSAQIDEALHQVGALAKSLDELETRLQPILRYPTPSEQPKQDVCEEVVKTWEQISGISSWVKKLETKLSDITSRVALS